jgi:hypothetical protein
LYWKKEFKMDELIQIVANRTGMPEEKAQIAVLEVLEYIQSRLPEPLSEEIEVAFCGGRVSEELIRSLGLFPMP